jgi:hypothetical protein
VNKSLIVFQTNDFKKPFFKNFLIKSPLFKIIPNIFLKRLAHILYYTFKFNNNVLFVDFDTNYNYLPFRNGTIFDRSSTQLYKTVKFFKINTIFYLNIRKKDFFLKKLFNLNCINISFNNDLDKSSVDLFLDLPNSKVTNYLMYIFTMGLYLKTKN